MYFVYVLISKKDKAFYIGFTENVEKRLSEHNRGEAVSTKSRRPLVLMYYEAHLSKIDALRRERYFKSSKGRTTLKQMLCESLRSGL
ncbi:MAG: GIY-YIG nuclease family protein [Candidatus Omnitrophica bacterium]|nr:GIY-YIG nuclease family protein [Candidatus Omnitrophota bacterium]